MEIYHIANQTAEAICMYSHIQCLHTCGKYLSIVTVIVTTKPGTKLTFKENGIHKEKILYKTNTLKSESQQRCRINFQQPSFRDHRDVITSLLLGLSRPWFNIKMTSYQYRKSHFGDKTVVRSCNLNKGISYTGKMTSLYWITPRARFLSLTQSKLRLCSANHRAGYFSNLACDWLSTGWA